MDKIKFKVNKKLLYCITIITIIGIIAGSIFITVLNDVDKETVSNSLNTFITNVSNNELNYSLSLRSNLVSNFIFIFVVWILGMTVVGIPIIIFMYFIKTFILGFSLSAIILKYGAKGIIYSFIYVFPHNILNLFIFAILTIYSLIYSFKLTDKLTKNENINYKNNINKHKNILLLSMIGVLLTSLYATYIMPYLFKIVLNLLK